MNPLSLQKQILSLPSIRALTNLLKLKKISQPEPSVRIIIQQTVKNFSTSTEKSISPGKIFRKINKLIKMRSYHCPVQYLLGRWYFRQLAIRISPPLLIPRFETQNLVSLIIESIRNKWKKGSQLNVVDYCCGTGVIGLSLIKQLEKDYSLNVTFIDIKPKALKFTKINADINCIPIDDSKLIVGDMLDYLHLIQTSHVIVSNPPYLSQRTYNRLQKQVKMYQDPMALVSGTDGLNLVLPLASLLLEELQRREDLVAGIEFAGQSLHEQILQRRVVLDQYSKRRYLIF